MTVARALRPQRFPWLSALIAIVFALAAAGVSGLVTGGSADPWYDSLTKPPFTPPDIAFAVIWPLLFALMITGALLVLRRAGGFAPASDALGLFYTQLALGAGWSVYFHGFQEVGVALGIVAALWIAILAMMRSFARISPLAAGLQVPYLIWISVAAYLNAGVMALN